MIYIRMIEVQLINSCELAIILSDFIMAAGFIYISFRTVSWNSHYATARGSTGHRDLALRATALRGVTAVAYRFSIWWRFISPGEPPRYLSNMRYEALMENISILPAIIHNKLHFGILFASWCLDGVIKPPQTVFPLLSHTHANILLY